MATAQSGIFSENTDHHRTLFYDIGGDKNGDIGGDKAGSLDAVTDALADLLDHADNVIELHLVIGFAGNAIDLLDIDTPQSFGRFEGVGSGEHAPVIDQHDLVVWLHGKQHDDVVDAAMMANRALRPVATLADDVAGFIYRDHRDLTGFIDGTANPPVAEAFNVAVVPDGEVGAGGSVFFLQRWVHDLETFEAKSLDEQEKTFGRTKADSIELAAKPDNSHVGRVEIHDEHGEELKIYRRSVSYVRGPETGLLFKAFTDDQSKIERMLGRMFGQDDGQFDRITAFSRAVATGFYFVPSNENLLVALR